MADIDGSDDGMKSSQNLVQTSDSAKAKKSPVYEVELTNYNNEQYVGSIWFGDGKQKIPVMFDTGSPMVYVLTQDCSNELCPQEQKFAQTGSGTYKADADGETDVLAHCYGQGCVSGSVSKDLMCFTDTKDTKNGCLHNGLFLAVKEATDIEKDKFSGIVGLGPKSDVGRMPSFIEQVAGLGGVGGEDEI